jgi:pyruvate/2-oxoglutarate dehydrogenase complex dihydrolipoamide dehydrogenase (E3) component
LNVGCIPSKALLHAARVIDEAAHFGALGIEFGAPKIDLDKLRAYKDKVVAQLTGGPRRHGQAAQGHPRHRRPANSCRRTRSKVDGARRARSWCASSTPSSRPAPRP